jgi:hypothetical protein
MDDHVKKLDCHQVSTLPLARCRDAWAQGGAKRLFGHYEDGVFVVAELGPGLNHR